MNKLQTRLARETKWLMLKYDMRDERFNKDHWKWAKEICSKRSYFASYWAWRIIRISPERQECIVRPSVY